MHITKHAVHRLKERYGFSFKREDLEKMGKMIESGDTLSVKPVTIGERYNRTVVLHYRGQLISLRYDYRNNTIITVLEASHNVPA